MSGAELCPRCRRPLDTGTEDGGCGCPPPAVALPRPVDRPAAGPDPADLAMFPVDQPPAAAPEAAPAPEAETAPQPVADAGAGPTASTAAVSGPGPGSGPDRGPGPATGDVPASGPGPDPRTLPATDSAGAPPEDFPTMLLALPPAPAVPDGPRRRRRPARAVALAVFVAVLAAGGTALAAGLLDGDDRTEGAVPDGGRTTAVQPTAELTGTGGLPPVPSPTSASPSGSPSAPPSASPSASPSTGTPTPSATVPDTPKDTPSPRSPSPTAATGRPSVSAAPTKTPAPPGSSGTLRPGDQGPQVAELQQRLAQLGLYRGTPDGVYDNQVTGAVAWFQYAYEVRNDPMGVYGPHTRRTLEQATRN